MVHYFSKVTCLNWPRKWRTVARLWSDNVTYKTQVRANVSSICRPTPEKKKPRGLREREVRVVLPCDLPIIRNDVENPLNGRVIRRPLSPSPTHENVVRIGEQWLRQAERRCFQSFNNAGGRSHEVEVAAKVSCFRRSRRSRRGGEEWARLEPSSTLAVAQGKKRGDASSPRGERVTKAGGTKRVGGKKHDRGEKARRTIVETTLPVVA